MSMGSKTTLDPMERLKEHCEGIKKREKWEKKKKSLSMRLIYNMRWEDNISVHLQASVKFLGEHNRFVKCFASNVYIFLAPLGAS